MKLSFYTPDGIHYEEEAISVIVPLIDGLAGIMKDHSPMLAKLSDGIVKGSGSKNQFKYSVKNGFIEILDNKITILADEVIPG